MKITPGGIDGNRDGEKMTTRLSRVLVLFLVICYEHLVRLHYGTRESVQNKAFFALGCFDSLADDPHHNFIRHLFQTRPRSPKANTIVIIVG